MRNSKPSFYFYTFPKVLVGQHESTCIALWFLYIITGVLPPVEWSCLFPPPVFHSKFKTTFCTPTRLLRIFTLYFRVDFKIFVDALKVLSWFVIITYTHAFLDALPTKYSIWSLLSPACFEVFPHFPRRLRWRSSLDPLHIPLIDVPLMHFGLAFPEFSVFRLVFPHFTLILLRRPDHLSLFQNSVLPHRFQNNIFFAYLPVPPTMSLPFFNSLSAAWCRWVVDGLKVKFEQFGLKFWQFGSSQIWRTSLAGIQHSFWTPASEIM